MGVKAIAIRVDDVESSYRAMVNNGAKSIVEPYTVTHNIISKQSNSKSYIYIYLSSSQPILHTIVKGQAMFAEVHLYGNVNLRLINSDDFTGAVIANLLYNAILLYICIYS